MREKLDFKKYPRLKFEGQFLEEKKARGILDAGGDRMYALMDVIFGEDDLLHFKRTAGIFCRILSHIFLVFGLLFFAGLWLPFLTGDYPLAATEKHPEAFLKMRGATLGIFIFSLFFTGLNIVLWCRQVSRLVSIKGIEPGFVWLRERILILRYVAALARSGCFGALFLSFFTFSNRSTLLVALVGISAGFLLLWQVLQLAARILEKGMGSGSDSLTIQ